MSIRTAPCLVDPKALTRARKAAGLSITDAGRAAGVSRASAAAWEAGETLPTVRRQHGRLAWQGVGVDHPGLLGERIERILRGGVLPEVSRARKIAVALCCLGAVILAAACRERPFYTGALKEDPKYGHISTRQQAERDFANIQAMSPQQVAELESRIKANPEDLDARRKLIRFYQYKTRPEEGAGSPSGAASAEREKMLAGLRSQRLWFIEHHPGDAMSAWFSPVSDPAGERSAEKLWKAHISNPKAPSAVLSHAASFFQFQAHDKPLAERLLLRAVEADPNGPWERQLGILYVSVKGGVKLDHWGGGKVDQFTGGRGFGLRELQGAAEA